MGLKKYVDGQWVDDSGVDVPVKEVKIDNTSIVDNSTDTASIATTGSYDGDSISPSYNPLSTKGYVDLQISQLPEPMIYTGVISITADSTDTTKCSIAVSAPASVANIKKGFTYKVSFIAASPVYAGTIKIGDTLIAAKDAPKVDATWVVDIDWNVIPTGDEVEMYNAGKTVPQGTSVTIDGTTYTVGAGAEIFNDYTNNKAVGAVSHAEGGATKAIGANSHAEGAATTASESMSHAEGGGTIASGWCAHAEGQMTTASGMYAHSEGSSTVASGNMSHAEGVSTIAKGMFSHAEGNGTIARGDSSHVEGKYNTEDSQNKFAHIIGNGTADNARSNAFAVDWDGRIYTHNSATGFDIQSNYIEFPNGQRLYNSSTAPTGDIPDGSIGVGW